MNPKAIRAEEMFGETDRLSGEVGPDNSMNYYRLLHVMLVQPRVTVVARRHLRCDVGKVQ